MTLGVEFDDLMVFLDDCSFEESRMSMELVTMDSSVDWDELYPIQF